MKRLKKVPNEMVNEWLAILPDLHRRYPSKNNGFENSNRQAYMIIADRYNVHHTTVYNNVKKAWKGRMARRGYASKHQELRYHIADVVAEVYQDDFELPLCEVVNRVSEFSGIKIRKSSLETLLNGYENHPNGKPLLKSNSDNYVLNGDFYATQKHNGSLNKVLNRIKE